MLFRIAEHFAHNIVCLAKRNAFAHEVVRCFCGKQGGIRGGCEQSVHVELCGREGARSNPQHVCNLVVGGKKSFFVFLQVALVAGRQPFQRCEQAEQRPGNASRLAANQFPRVGIFLLRH